MTAQPLRKNLPGDWLAANQVKFTDAEAERATAERLRAECARTFKDTEITTARTQKSTEHKLSQRIRDLGFWKQELEKKLGENIEETNLLLTEKKKLEDALINTNFPLEVANRCLEFRTKREKIDLVHDAVEVQLIKEVEVIQGVQALLQRALDQTVEQIRLLRAAKYRLDKDLNEKLNALVLDETCSNLTDRSEGIAYCENAAKIQSDSVTPEQWASFTNENILRSEKECNASSTLRGVICGVLEQTSQDIRKQRHTTNLEFSKKIYEITHAKKLLEHHYEKVSGEFDGMEENIRAMEKAIQDKTGPMKLAQTRLEIRSQRPNKELVRDQAQYGLVEEVNEISNSIETLQNRVAECKESLKGLRRNQLILEEDIGIKARSLFIEQDQCMALRNQLPT